MRQTLVRQNLPLVHALARRMAPTARPFLEVGDLVSIGAEALIQASRKYDRSRRVAFASFAYRRVKGAMVEGLGAAGPHSRGRRRRRAGRPDPLSLPVHCSYDDRRHAGAAGRDVAAMAAERIDAGRMAARLRAALEGLDGRERALTVRHYFAGEPMNDIASDLGISPAWASRLHARALARLRDALSR